MLEACNKNIESVLELSEKLLELAIQGEADSKDDTCILLYGIVRDSAYRIQKEALKEKEKHILNNKWK